MAWCADARAPGVDGPAAVEGDEGTRRHAYLKAFAELRRRIEWLAALPLEKLDRLTAEREVCEIGRSSG